MSDTGTCEKCGTEISTEAIACPKCGYEPSAEGSRLRSIFYFVGGILCITGVGAIIGIPMILFAYYSGSQVEGRKPTTHSPAQ